MKHRIFKLTLAGLALLALSGVSLAQPEVGPPIAVAAESPMAMLGVVGQQSSKDEVVALLSRWRDQVRPSVPDEERRKVDEYAAQYPPVEPAGAQPVSFGVQRETALQATPVVNRRDWAYAVQGTGYTLVGAIGKDQKAMLDVGFWCFLEAALLRPTEVEHLANVAFHLNLRQAYDDATAVLLFAGSLNDAFVAIHNNLAYAHSGRGLLQEAIEESQWAAALRPDLPIYRERLASYYERAGYDATGQAIRATTDLQTGQPLPQFSPSPAVSDEAQQVLDRIGDLAKETNDGMAQRWEAVSERSTSATEQFRYESDRLWGVWNDCYTNVLLKWENVALAGGDTPGPEGIHREACVECSTPYVSGLRSAVGAWYETLKPVVASYEMDAFTYLGSNVQRGNSLVTGTGLGAAEKAYLYSQVGEQVFAGEYEHTVAGSKALRDAWNESGERCRDLVSSMCGDAPVADLPAPPDEATTQCGGTRPFFINFIVGTLEKAADCTWSLSLGQGLIAKMELNTITGETGAGFGLGVNLGALEGEINLIVRRQMKVESGVELQLAVPPGIPVPGPWPGGPGVPKIAATYVVFEN